LGLKKSLKDESKALSYDSGWCKSDKSSIPDSDASYKKAVQSNLKPVLGASSEVELYCG
jgi:hypothetical protein